jgi:hypothetical protein
MQLEKYCVGVAARTRDTNWANHFPLSSVANSTCRILPVWYGARRSRIPSPTAGIPRGAAPPTSAAAGKGELAPSSVSRQNLLLPLSPPASSGPSAPLAASPRCPGRPEPLPHQTAAAHRLGCTELGRLYLRFWEKVPGQPQPTQMVLLSSVFPISS